MNVAGRKIVGSISTSVEPGPQRVERRLDAAGHASVLPPGCFSTISSRPGPSLMTASPIGGGKPSTTSATSPSGSGAPLAERDRRPAPRSAARRIDAAVA